MSLSKVYDVLIVGAGPVGLATGLSLYKRGIKNILITDQTRSFRRVGQVVDLLPNGLKAIKYIDEQAYQQVKKAGLEFMQIPSNNGEVKPEKTPQKRFWYRKNLQGEVTRTIPLDFDYWLENYGEGRVSIPWYDLQTNLRNLLPSEIVKTNHRCVNITQDITQEKQEILIDFISNEEKNTNPFAHWEMQSLAQLNQINYEEKKIGEKQLKAKLVVAADGINSTIRKILYNDSKLKQWAKPQYSGWAAVSCMEIEGISDEIIQELEDKYFQSERLVTINNDALPSEKQNLESPRLMLIRRGKNTVGCLFNLPVSINLLENQSPEAIINLTVEILTKTGFPPLFSDLIKLSNLDKLLIRPYYIHPANIPHSQPMWSKGRLVLVGDAAHGMPPFMAQGANQGLEDAAVISKIIANIIEQNALDNLELIDEQFSKYEQLRRPFMEKIQAAIMENHNWNQTEWDSYSNLVYNRNVEQLIGN